VTADRHTAEQAPGKPLSAPVSASTPGVGISGGSDPLSGPQTGAQQFQDDQHPRGPIDWARQQAAEREATNTRDKDAELRHANEQIERLTAQLELRSGYGLDPATLWPQPCVDRIKELQRQVQETRSVLDEVLRHFVHKGHPGEPCLQTGWISEKTVARWRAVLYPPQPAHNAGPSVAECAANDRAHWDAKYAGEGQ
jgi:hypothetical protein